MRALTLGAALFVGVGMLSSPATAYDGILACWFNESGTGAGADSGSGEVGSLERQRESGDYTYAFYIGPGESCPKSITPPNPAPAIDSVVWPSEGSVHY